MPLPDERPRQSVANLIGRFEQQGKRLPSPAAPVALRSSSVSSQTTGDVAKEEVREKREWPPKPVASPDVKPSARSLFGSPPSTSESPVASPQPVPDPPPPDIPTTPTPASPEPVKSPPSKGKNVAPGKSTPVAGTRRSGAAPAKSRSPATSSSNRPSVSSPPKTSLQSSVSQPLRQQHTGQSAASNPSATRQSRPVPRTAPSTPSRPKSSTTQNQPVSRPKTPSSGLFAPTAASLARSRNAPPPPPPPVKKVTLSSDAAERLSKPTAASLSKARAPVLSAQSPAKVTKSTSSGPHGSTPRGPTKLKVAVRTLMKPTAASTEEGTKPGLASVSSDPSSDLPVVDHVENGHELGTAACSDVGSPEDTHVHSEAVSDVAHNAIADEDVHSDPGVLPEQQEDEYAAEDAPREEAAPERQQIHSEVHEDPAPEPVEFHASQAITNGNSLEIGFPSPGNDIEDIVNLLEGAPIPKPRPQSIVSIPDENPDEC